MPCESSPRKWGISGPTSPTPISDETGTTFSRKIEKPRRGKVALPAKRGTAGRYCAARPHRQSNRRNSPIIWFYVASLSSRGRRRNDAQTGHAYPLGFTLGDMYPITLAAEKTEHHHHQISPSGIGRQFMDGVSFLGQKETAPSHAHGKRPFRSFAAIGFPACSAAGSYLDLVAQAKSKANSSQNHDSLKAVGLPSDFYRFADASKPAACGRSVPESVSFGSTVRFAPAFGDNAIRCGESDDWAIGGVCL